MKRILLSIAIVMTAVSCNVNPFLTSWETPYGIPDFGAVKEKHYVPAFEAGVGKLLVGHYSSRFPSVDFFLDELRSIFPDTELAHDGDVIEI